MKVRTFFRDEEPGAEGSGDSDGGQHDAAPVDWEAEAKKFKAELEKKEKRFEGMKAGKSKAETELAALKQEREDAALTAEEKAAKVRADFDAYKAEQEAKWAARDAKDQIGRDLAAKGVSNPDYQDYLFEKHLKDIDPEERNAKIDELAGTPALAAFFGTVPASSGGSGSQTPTPPQAPPPGTPGAGPSASAIDWKQIERNKKSDDPKVRKAARKDELDYYKQHGKWPDDK